MAEQVFKSPGVTTREIDLSGPGTVSPQGIPAGVIGTAQKGPAFVPVTFATYKDFVTKFGGTDGKLFGPMAVSEWMKNARAGTYLRVLGIGDGKQRNTNGTVTNAGFTVGGQQIQADGNTGVNPYATSALAHSAGITAVAAASPAGTLGVQASVVLRVDQIANVETGVGAIISQGANSANGGIYVTGNTLGDLNGAVITITPLNTFKGDDEAALAPHTITLESANTATAKSSSGKNVNISISDGSGGAPTQAQIAGFILQAFKRDSSFAPGSNGRTGNTSIDNVFQFDDDWQLSSATAGGDLDSVFVATIANTNGVKLQYRGSGAGSKDAYSGGNQKGGRYGGAIVGTGAQVSIVNAAGEVCHTHGAQTTVTAGNATGATTLTLTDADSDTLVLTANAASNAFNAGSGYDNANLATAIKAAINTGHYTNSTISSNDITIITDEVGATGNSAKIQVANGDFGKYNPGSTPAAEVANVTTETSFAGGATEAKRAIVITFTDLPLEGDIIKINDGSSQAEIHSYQFGDAGLGSAGYVHIQDAADASAVALAFANTLIGAAVTTSWGGIADITEQGTEGTAFSAQTLQVNYSGATVTISQKVGAGAANKLFTVTETERTGAAAALGRTYFLSAVMEDKNSSGYMANAGLTSAANPILRGVLMVASGCALGLSGWGGSRLDDVSSFAYDDYGTSHDAGHQVGCVDLRPNGDENFVMFLNGFTNTSKHQAILTASMNPKSPNYFSKVFNTDPTKIEETGHLLYTHYDVPPHICGIASEDAAGSDHTDEKTVKVYHRLLLQSGSLARNTMGSSTHYCPNFEGFQDRFAHAVSPYVISQTLGTAAQNLFRFHALDAGTAGNTQYKISIANVKKSTDPVSDYGSFDVYIRVYGDSDEEMQILEKYTSVDLNPASDRYIARLIGTQNVYFDFDKQTANQKLVIDGLYPNRSQYVRIQVVDDIENGVMEPTALPMGFRGKKHLALDGTKPLAPLDASATTGIDEAGLDDGLREPPVPLRMNVTQGKGNTSKVESRYFWGTQFELQDRADELNKSSVHASLIDNFTKYFPSYGTYPAFVGANENTAATAGGTSLDADVYNYNMFTMERIWVKCKSGSTSNAVDPREWVEAVYCRSGSAPGAGDMVETNGETHKTAGNGYRFLDVSKDFAQQASRRYFKFSFFMQGGFDGLNIYNKDISEMTNPAAHREMANATTLGGAEASTVAAYRKALDIMAEKSDVDVQLLAIPGIREPGVTDYAIDKTEERFDALYIMDIQECEHAGTLDSNVVTGSIQEISVANTVSKLQDRNLDTSFAAVYFPDVVVVDGDTNSNVRTPPSVSVLGAMALNDTVAHPWFAPAGFTRGALGSALESQVKLSRINMDALYEVDINPITSFPTSEGVVVFGQKTLLQAQSSLDRVNVRRLLIDIRRKVKKVANKILFEPNRDSTLARFSAAVQPILTTIQAQQGLDRFKVVIDATTTTQQDVENNTVRGKIYLQPTKAVEFISLDFVVTNAGTEI